MQLYADLGNSTCLKNLHNLNRACECYISLGLTKNVFCVSIKNIYNSFIMYKVGNGVNGRHDVALSHIWIWVRSTPSPPPPTHKAKKKKRATCNFTINGKYLQRNLQLAIIKLQLIIYIYNIFCFDKIRFCFHHI